MGKKAARKAAMAFFQQTPNPDPQKPEKPLQTLSTALEEYLIMEKGLLAEGTQKFIRFCVLRWFQEASWGRWEDISPLSVQKGYMAVLKALKAGEMQAKYWASVRCYAVDFCQYAVMVGCLKDNPVKALPAPKKALFRKTQVVWSEDEFRAIHSLLEPFLAMQFWLMRYTGMDLADLAGVRRFHLTRDPGMGLEEAEEEGGEVPGCLDPVPPQLVSGGHLPRGISEDEGSRRPPVPWYPSGS
jgi:integrase